MSPRVRSAMIEILMAGLLVVVWAHVFAAALYFGLPWKLLGRGLRPLESLSVERCLFAADANAPVPLALVGGRAFLAGLAPLVRGPRPLLIDIPRNSLEDTLAAVKAMERLAPGRILVQNQPHYWSNFNFVLYFGGSQQNLDRWDRYRRYRLRLLPLADARVMFDTLGLWADGIARPDRQPQDQRPATLQNAEFDLDRIRKDFFGDAPAYGPEIAKRLYWVTDLDHLPADIDPRLAQAFMAAFPRGGFDPAIGNFIEPRDIPEVLADREGDRRAP